MTLSRRIKAVLMGVLICLGLSTAAYAGLYGWIQADAYRKADAILIAYPAAHDKVEAAMLQMQSSSCTMRQRNQAVWVLGRLSDEKALPVLEEAYTGQPCEHGTHLCQYELEKAIRRCGH